MTGKLINKSLVHDSVGMSHDCAPRLLEDAKIIKKLPKKQQVYVKSRCCSLYTPLYANICNRSETSVENFR
jgi:hypothetical protein